MNIFTRIIQDNVAWIGDHDAVMDGCCCKRSWTMVHIQSVNQNTGFSAGNMADLSAKYTSKKE